MLGTECVIDMPYIVSDDVVKDLTEEIHDVNSTIVMNIYILIFALIANVILICIEVYKSYKEYKSLSSNISTNGYEKVMASPSSQDSMKSLAMSTLCIFCLMACGSFTTDFSKHKREDGHEMLKQGIRWASVVSLMAGVYYLQYHIWRRCFRRNTIRHQIVPPVRPITMYRDLPQYFGSSTPSSSSDDLSASSSYETTDTFSVISPELTIENVWIHVYCWGLLIFVSLYCLPGIYIPGSCWFSFGMLVLCIDELISCEFSKYSVLAMGNALVLSIFFVWWGTVGMDAKNQTVSEVITGVAIPALVPFIFFSVRSNVRNSVKDIPRLFEFAFPFVIFLSVFILVITPRDELVLRRDGRFRTVDYDNFNRTETFSETHANFSHLNETTRNFIRQDISDDNWRKTLLSFVPFTALCLSPIFSILAMYLATYCVINSCATEFIVALVLNVAGKFGATREYDAISALAIIPAGLAFVMILILRKII